MFIRMRQAVRMLCRYGSAGEGPRVSPEQMKVIEEMPFYRSFQEGVNLTQRNNL